MANTNQDWEEINPMDTPIWQPQKEGDEVVGILEHIDEDVGPNKSRLYTLRQPNGELIKLWGSTLLDNRFQFIKIGEEVKIVFQGEKTGQKSNRKYLDFKVYHRPAPSQPSQANEPPDDIPF